MSPYDLPSMTVAIRDTNAPTRTDCTHTGMPWLHSLACVLGRPTDWPPRAYLSRQNLARASRVTARTHACTHARTHARTHTHTHTHTQRTHAHTHSPTHTLRLSHQLRMRLGRQSRWVGRVQDTLCLGKAPSATLRKSGNIWPWTSLRRLRRKRLLPLYDFVCVHVCAYAYTNIIKGE